MSTGAGGLRLYSNAELGVRFEIDESFVAGPRLEPPAELPGDVRSAYLIARGPGAVQAVLSLTRVEVGYDTSPRSSPSTLSFTIATRRTRPNSTAGRSTRPGRRPCWAATRPCTATTWCPDRPPRADRPDAVGAVPTAAAASAGHVQEWIAYVGRQTFQLMLGVDPPATSLATGRSWQRSAHVRDRRAAGRRCGRRAAPAAGEPPPGGRATSPRPLRDPLRTEPGMARRRRVLTRGAFIAWAVSLAAGIAWVVGLGALPASLGPSFAGLLAGGHLRRRDRHRYRHRLAGETAHDGLLAARVAGRQRPCARPGVRHLRHPLRAAVAPVR